MVRPGKICTLTASNNNHVRKRIFSITPDPEGELSGELPSVTLENLKLKSEASRITVVDFDVQGSLDAPDGGCMFVKNARLILENVVFEDCVARNKGGGLFIVRRFMTLRFIFPCMIQAV